METWTGYNHIMNWLKYIIALRQQTRPAIHAATASDGSITYEGNTLSVVGPVDWWAGVDVLPIAQGLIENPPDVLDLYIDSPGGSLFDGLALRASLDHAAKHGTTIRSSAGATVGSVAVPIFLAGVQRTAQMYTQFMIHAPRGAAVIAGTLTEIDRSMADYRAALAAATTMYRDTIAVVIGSKERADEWIANGDTWFNASEAKMSGLVMAVESTTPPAEEISAEVRRQIMAQMRRTVGG